MKVKVGSAHPTITQSNISLVNPIARARLPTLCAATDGLTHCSIASNIAVYHPTALTRNKNLPLLGAWKFWKFLKGCKFSDCSITKKHIVQYTYGSRCWCCDPRRWCYDRRRWYWDCVCTKAWGHAGERDDCTEYMIMFHCCLV